MNGIGHRTMARRLASASLCAAVLLAASAARGSDSPEPSPRAALHDGAHDFDFDLGTWRTRSSRLLHPLTGSSRWIEMHGTTTVTKVWGGRANLAEFEATGPMGRLDLISLRLYDPAARQWSLSFATASVGVLGVSSIGQFKNGRGDFYDQETAGGRSILVRFSIWAVDADTARSEQAFSDDGGKTWEINWINRYTRIRP